MRWVRRNVIGHAVLLPSPRARPGQYNGTPTPCSDENTQSKAHGMFNITMRVACAATATYHCRKAWPQAQQRSSAPTQRHGYLNFINHVLISHHSHRQVP